MEADSQGAQGHRMRELGPTPRFPTVATQSLPITSGEGLSRSFISAPTPTSPGVRNSGHDKAAEICMEEGQPLL